jgi:hypothetical protein
MRGKRRDGTTGLRSEWGMSFSESDLGFYGVDVLVSIILLQEVGCI